MENFKVISKKVKKSDLSYFPFETSDSFPLEKFNLRKALKLRNADKTGPSCSDSIYCDIIHNGRQWLR